MKSGCAERKHVKNEIKNNKNGGVRKGLINIQNIADNDCVKWSIVRYLHPADYNPKSITNADKCFAKKLDYKDIKFPVKVRDISKIEKKNSIGISPFGYKNRENHPHYVSKKCC